MYTDKAPLQSPAPRRVSWADEAGDRGGAGSTDRRTRAAASRSPRATSGDVDAPEGPQDSDEDNPETSADDGTEDEDGDRSGGRMGRDRRQALAGRGSRLASLARGIPQGMAVVEGT